MASINSDAPSLWVPASLLVSPRIPACVGLAAEQLHMLVVPTANTAFLSSGQFCFSPSHGLQSARVVLSAFDSLPDHGGPNGGQPGYTRPVFFYDDLPSMSEESILPLHVHLGPS
ncbi:hypothetical protein GDO81_026640 [Engystomops pustulosus]|uniref:Uncharacterized protein n=1 Tax=Engystomops pustulosus TaxID=76066 RepID=A0AAV6YFL2_ENGPU|nr:hypothetical protein GDO81_026640 [Engystomops pustulosus]